jgi:serine/threonine protein kinase
MKGMRKSNILHRDLKSANIMLKGSDIKVVDFGLATKFYHGEMLYSYSGTPSNMAP